MLAHGGQEMLKKFELTLPHCARSYDYQSLKSYMFGHRSIFKRGGQISTSLTDVNQAIFEKHGLPI